MFELCGISALIIVGIICLIVPPFSGLFPPKETVFGIDMSMYFVIVVFMMMILTPLAALVGRSTPKYNAYTCVKGSNFPVPFYIDCAVCGRNQPMLCPEDYKVNGKEFAPVWKDNYEWEDELRLDPSFKGKLLVFNSTINHVSYLFDPQNMKSLANSIHYGVVKGKFTFFRQGQVYTIVPVGSNIESD